METKTVETRTLELTPSELRLIHELMFFIPHNELAKVRKSLIEGPECDAKREFFWGDFLKRKPNEVYKTLARKLDMEIMVAPIVVRKSLEE